MFSEEDVNAMLNPLYRMSVSELEKDIMHLTISLQKADNTLKRAKLPEHITRLRDMKKGIKLMLKLASKELLNRKTHK